MNKEKLLEKFSNMIKSNFYSEMEFRRVQQVTFNPEEVVHLLPYLVPTHSHYIRYAVFELLVNSGHDAIHLFETYFKEEKSTVIPSKIIGLACKRDDADLILAVYSHYPSLATQAIMSLKKMGKYDAIMPFMFSDNISLANIANEIMKNNNE